MRADAGAGERMETQWWKLKFRDAAEPVVVDGMVRDGSAAEPDFVLYDVGGHEKLRIPKGRLAHVERLTQRQAEREVFRYGARTFATSLDGAARPRPRVRAARFQDPDDEGALAGVASVLRFGLRRPEHKFLVLWAMIAATTTLGWWRLTPNHVRTLAAYELLDGADGRPGFEAWRGKWSGLLREATRAHSNGGASAFVEHPFVRDVRVLDRLAAREAPVPRRTERWRAVAIVHAALFAEDGAGPGDDE